MSEPTPKGYTSVADAPYNVLPNGSDMTAGMQLALDSGKDLFIPAGTYKFTAQLDQDTAHGQRILGSQVTRPTLSWVGAGATHGVVCTVDAVTWQSVKFLGDGSQGGERWGFEARGATANGTIVDCAFDDWDDAGCRLGYTNPGDPNEHATNWHIEDCDFDNTADGAGLELWGDRHTVVNCRASGNVGKAGFRVLGLSTGEFVNAGTVVRGCTDDGSGFGMSIQNAEDALIEDFTSLNATDRGIYILNKTNRVGIRGFTVTDAANYGVMITTADVGTVVMDYGSIAGSGTANVFVDGGDLVVLSRSYIGDVTGGNGSRVVFCDNVRYGNVRLIQNRIVTTSANTRNGVEIQNGQAGKSVMVLGGSIDLANGTDTVNASATAALIVDPDPQGTVVPVYPPLTDAPTPQHGWEMDGALTDVTGIANLGQYRANTNTSEQTPSYGPGRIGRAVVVPAGDYLACPTSRVVDAGTADFWVAFWVNCTSLSTNGPTLVSCRESAGDGWQVSLGSDNKTFRLRLDDGTTADNQTLYTMATTIDSSVWRHFAVSVDRDGDTKVWEDGVLKATKTTTAATGTLLPGSEDYFFNVNAFNSNASTAAMNASWDAVYFGAGTLSQQDVDALFAVSPDTTNA